MKKSHFNNYIIISAFTEKHYNAYMHWLLFVSVHTNLQDLIPTLALVVCVAYNS